MMEFDRAFRERPIDDTGKIMNKSSATLVLVACALGLPLGYFTNRAAPSDSAAAANKGSDISTRVKSRSREASAGANPLAALLPATRSGETVGSLVAQGESAAYASLALWLLDASAEDIAAYWESGKTMKLDGDKKRLIFINWTRLDPRAAIDAAAGTENEATPWWAWASHDPQAALAAADGARIRDVARGIGEFQPKWLRENFDLIPEEARQEALKGITTWKEDSDHVATLDLLKEHGVSFSSNLFRTLARKDPWAAYDWLQKNDKLDPKDNGALDILLDTMKSQHPDDLDRLAAMVPSGPLKWKMEDALFQKLLATDPEAALERAKATEAPLIAAQRMAEIGALRLHSDPEGAFAIAADILAANPNRLSPQHRIDAGNYSSSSSSPSTTEKFMESLLIKDPARTLDMTLTGTETVTHSFQTLSQKWVERDLNGYTKWVNEQADGPVRNAAVGKIAGELASQGNFQEAATWAMSGDKKVPDNFYNLAWQWSRSNRAEASAWVESVELPDTMKNNLRSMINQP